METSTLQYQSYLLRLWRDDAGTLLRATLQSTATQSVVEFASLDALSSFLLTTKDHDHGSAGAADDDHELE